MKGLVYICKNCGYMGEAEKKVSGSFWLEILLWFLFIIPGLIYSVTRYAKKILVCPECGKETLILTTSPMGEKLAKGLIK